MDLLNFLDGILLITNGRKNTIVALLHVLPLSTLRENNYYPQVENTRGRKAYRNNFKF